MNYRQIGKKLSQAKGKIVLGATTVAISAANAASVTIPASTQTDLEGSVNSAGAIALAVIVLVVGFGVVISMLKKGK